MQAGHASLQSGLPPDTAAAQGLVASSADKSVRSKAAARVDGTAVQAPDRATADDGMRVAVRLRGEAVPPRGPSPGQARMSAPQAVTGAQRLAQAAVMPATEASAATFTSAPEPEAAEVSFPPPGQVATAAGRYPVAAPASAEAARHVAAQLADALPQAASREIELTLNPRELGRVRISLSQQDSGLTMAITTERGETADLMRRHIDQLAREFRDLGYGDVTFSFGQSGQGHRGNDPGSHPDGDTIALVPDDAVAQPAIGRPGPGLDPATGLDLRV